MARISFVTSVFSDASQPITFLVIDRGYQQKLDQAQERLKEGEISQAEFDALKKDLDESMPDRVRDLLPDEFKPERELQQAAELVIDAAPLSRPGPMPMMDTP